MIFFIGLANLVCLVGLLATCHPAPTLADSSMGIDQRKFVRVKPEREHPVTVDIMGDNFMELLKAIDISEGGIAICVPHKFKGCDINEVVDFVIGLPLSEKVIFVKASGKIKHVTSDRFGVHFLTLQRNGKCLLRDYIAQKLREESIIKWFKYKFHVMFDVDD